jgi:phosphoglycolate phosphatase
MQNIIFDLDGTLVDTPAAIVATARAATGLPHADEGIIRAAIGLPLEVALARALRVEVSAPAVDAAVERYRAIWRAEVSPQLAGLVYPGVHEGLRALRARGMRLGIATGKNQAGALRTVSESGLADYFDVVAGHDLVPQPKPHADLALYVLRKLDGAADDTVVVGDSVLDLGMARAAGLRSIAVTYGAQDEAALRRAEPTWVARSFAEVVAFLS